MKKIKNFFIKSLFIFEIGAALFASGFFFLSVILREMGEKPLTVAGKGTEITLGIWCLVVGGFIVLRRKY